MKRLLRARKTIKYAIGLARKLPWLGDHKWGSIRNTTPIYDRLTTGLWRRPIAYFIVLRALRILFPPECLHCKKGHEKLGVPLCQTCVSHLEVRQADKLLITFERLSPAKSLITSFKKGNSMGSAKILAAYMAIQYVQSSFSLPDLVTAVPSTRFRKWQALGASAEMLAAELAAILQSPYVSTLKRKRQLLRQDFLDREQRLCLSSDDFVLKSEVSVKGKVVLLVDDTITTGSTLQCCAEHLWQASSRKVIKMACLDQGYLKD